MCKFILYFTAIFHYNMKERAGILLMGFICDTLRDTLGPWWCGFAHFIAIFTCFDLYGVSYNISKCFKVS